ncbi:MAG: WD40 repeat domain-containing serine/threonine protein kinase [Pirellulales bacterium]
MDDSLIDLLEQFDERVRTGRRNSERAAVDVAHLQAPTRQALADSVKCLRLIDRVRRTSAVPSATAPASVREDGGAGRRQIGRFHIIRELGSGGHGVVYLAWDPAARRQVALKVPHPEALFSLKLRERFLREGIAAARLSHPNIVSVLEVDRSGPLCYIVSAYSEGRSLTTVVNDFAGRLPPRLVARWVAELADAVEHAHRHGVLHRDLKPANVVLEPIPRAAAGDEELLHDASADAVRDPLADLVPKLTDFGLAKLIDAGEARTCTGAILGTPAYLAPEQVDSTLGAVGPRADVYGLGTILYECVTGRPPFVSESPAELLRRIATEDVAAPRSMRKDLPADIEAICLRAMARRPHDRYASAVELAADLRRYLADEMTWARPLSEWGRLLKWSRRRPAAAVAMAGTLVAVIVLTAGALWHSRQMDVALEVAEEARGRAELGERNLRRLVYLRDMQETHQALEAHDVLKASTVLARHRAVAGAERPGFLWRHLHAKAHGMPIERQAHRGHAHTVEFSADGDSVLTAGADGSIRIWDAATGDARAIWSLPDAEINVARFSPDGATIAVADSEGRLWLWDVAAQKPRGKLPAAALVNINCLAWTSDGARILVAGSPGDVAVEWVVDNRESRVIRIAHSDEVNALALSPNDLYLATGSSDGAVHVCNVALDLCLARLVPRQAHVTCVAFSPDGQLLATAGVHRSVKLWNVDGWTTAAEYVGQHDRIGAVAFAPVRGVLAFCDAVGVVREWDWAANRVVRALDSRQVRIMSASYSPSGPRFATCGQDGSLRIWDFRRSEIAKEPVADSKCSAAVFTKDSRYLFTTDRGGMQMVFDTRDRSARLIDERKGEFGFIDTLAAVGESEIGMLCQSSRQAVYRQGPVLGPKRSVRLVNQKEPDGFAIQRDGRVLITTQRYTADFLRFWDAATGKLLGTTPDRDPSVTSLACANQHDLLAIGGDGVVRLWDLRRNRYVQRLTGHDGAVECVAFSPDDKILAGAGKDGQVLLWDPVTGVPSQVVLRHASPVRCLAFCPDDSVLVTGDEAGTVRAWSLDNGEELIQFADFSAPVEVVTFSPDAQWLVAGYYYGLGSSEMRVWHAPP